MSTNLGSAYVNDFPSRGRMQRVIVQADHSGRMQTDEILGFHVQNSRGGRTCIVFGGCCAIQKKLRAFRIETDTQNQQRKSEVLTDTDMEIFGEGKAAAAARKLMPPEAKEPQIVEVLQSVIDDPNVPSVGGNIQYGSFFGSRFQPHGVAKITDGEAHYWRASLDLNGPDFDQVKGLVPVFPLLNLTGV
jgi:hypothetical protein